MDKGSFPGDPRTGETNMNKIIEQEPTEGLNKLLGERVTLFCAVYIYSGRLIGVNDTCVLLEDAGIVYETGELLSKEWKDYQKLPGDWYIQRSMIESFGVLK
jgi:hypothetical protein